MTVINISKEEFIKEITQWGANKNALIKVRMMRKGNLVYFRFQTPKGETIQTIFPREDYDEFEWMNLNAVSVPAIWNDETEELNKINQKLEELNATNFTPTGYQSIWDRRPTA